MFTGKSLCCVSYFQLHLQIHQDSTRWWALSKRKLDAKVTLWRASGLGSKDPFVCRFEWWHLRCCGIRWKKVQGWLTSTYVQWVERAAKRKNTHLIYRGWQMDSLAIVRWRWLTEFPESCCESELTGRAQWVQGWPSTRWPARVLTPWFVYILSMKHQQERGVNKNVDKKMSTSVHCVQAVADFFVCFFFIVSTWGVLSSVHTPVPHFSFIKELMVA